MGSAVVADRISPTLRFAFVFIAGFICVIIGAAIPILGPKYSILSFGILSTIVLLIVPVRVHLLLFVSFAFSLYGIAQYFFGIDFSWGAVLLCLPMVGAVGLESIASRRNGSRAPIFAPIALMAFLVSVAVVITLLNSPRSLHTAAIASRGVFVMWAVVAAVSWGNLRDQDFSRVLALLGLIALLQIPFAAYQRLVVVPKRLDETPWDAVVGTFPGILSGGGDSGSMAIYLVVALLFLLVLRAHRLLSNSWMAIGALVLLTPIVLAEVKVVIVLLPLAVMLAFRRPFLRNPIVGVVALGCVSAVAVLLVSLGMAAMGNTSARIGDLRTLGEAIFGLSLGTDAYGRGQEMGRVTALLFWFSKAGQMSVGNLLFGHGISSTWSFPMFDLGWVALKYPGLHFANTSAAWLLWETGVVGLVSFVAIFITGGMAAFRMGRDSSLSAKQRAWLDAAGCTLFLMTPVLCYTTALTGSSAATQFLAFFALGFVARAHRNSQAATR